MMILNTFPSLLLYGFYATFVLRVLMALVFIEFGFSKLTKEKKAKADFFEKLGLRPGKTYTLIFALLELAIGTLLLVGLYTQIAALLAAMILLATFTIKQKYPTLLKSEARYYFVLFIIALVLLTTGAGVFSFDLPL